MLSARHHVCYWILSITAVLVYQGLVTGLGFQENSFRIALIPLMGFAIYIIWNGPGHLSSEWHVHLQAATACLMVCLGSVSGHLEMSDASAEQVKPIFHTFLAFSTISALESIRQNVSHPLPLFSTSANTRQRKDIQPCIYVGYGCDFEIGIHLRGWPNPLYYFYSYFFVLLLFCGIYSVLALGLANIHGPEVSEETMGFIFMGVSRKFPSSLVLVYALVSLADIAVTVGTPKL